MWKIFLLIIIANTDLQLCATQNSNTDFKQSKTDNKQRLSAITYGFSRGRFGDNLISYAHALWAAHTLQLPLLYRQFEYSDQLALHDVNHRFYKRKQPVYEFQPRGPKNSTLDINKSDGKAYIIPFFPEVPFEIEKYGFASFDIDWNNTAFKTKLLAAIKPRVPIKKPALQLNQISVAAHVRRGGGFDVVRENAHLKKNAGKRVEDQLKPFKFPPDSFYIEQIQTIYELFKGSDLYVYIFTDDPNPAAIAKKYKTALGKKNITFDYRNTDNAHNKNVIQDFFAMTYFDCLIRPGSSYSIMAQRIGNHKLVISPAEWVSDENETVITKSLIEVNLP